MKSRFKIEGLDCANCAADLERSIQKIDGVESVSISFITQKMELEYDDEKENEIMQNVKKTIKKEEPDVSIEEV